MSLFLSKSLSGALARTLMGVNLTNPKVVLFGAERLVHMAEKPPDCGEIKVKTKRCR